MKKSLSIVLALALSPIRLGHEGLLYTDHKPLTFIFKLDGKILPTALQQIQQWSLYFANFSYVVEYRGKLNSQADALSRSVQEIIE